MMTFPRKSTMRPLGAVVLVACFAHTAAFAQSQKSILSLDSVPAKVVPMSQAVTAEEKLAAQAPANFHTFSTARTGQLADAEQLTIRFAETTKLTKIDSTKDFRVEQGSSCVVGNVYQAKSSCTLLVRFTPKGAGRRVGKLTISHTGSVTPFYVGLGGTGYAPVLSFMPAAITTVPASVVSGKGLLNGAGNLAVDGGDTVFVADTGNNVVRQLDSSGAFKTIAATSSLTVSAPYGITADSFGDVYFSEPAANLMFEIFNYNNFVRISGGGLDSCTVAAPCSMANEALYSPGQLSMDPYNQMFMVEGGNGAATGAVLPYSPKFARIFDPFTFQTSARGVMTVDANDNLYSAWVAGVCAITSQTFSDAANSRAVYKKVAGGRVCGFSGDGGPARNAELSNSIGQFAFDLAGDLYFTDTGNQRVRRIDAATGNINTIAGTGTNANNGDGGPATSAGLSNPTGVGVDSQGQVYVISSSPTGAATQVIRKIGPNGYLSFGNVPKNTSSAAKQVTLTNTGNSALTFTRVVISGGNPNDFTIDPNTSSCDISAGATLASGQSCKVGVIFKPTGAGNRASTVLFLDNTVTNSNTVQLFGTGTLPSPAFAITAPAAGSTSTSGTTVKFSVSVTASTTPAPTGTVTFSVDGAAFGAPVAVSAGAASVNLTGLTVKTHTISAKYSGDSAYAAAGPISESIIVVAAAAKPALSPTAQAFPAQKVATLSPVKTIKLSNTGTAAMTISAYALTGTNAADFSYTKNCGTSVAAGAYCSINVSFKPTAAGTRTASLAVTTSAGKVTVALSGTATAAAAIKSTVSLVTKANPAMVGQAVTFTSSVAAASGAKPTGKVQVKEGSKVLAEAALVNGVATLKLASLSSGTHVLNAVYVGDAQHMPATSAAVQQAVVRPIQRPHVVN